MKDKKGRIKYWIGQVHLWLGFSSGLIVFIVALTGCIYAFQYEIQELTQSYRHVEKQDQSFLPPTELRGIAEKELPGKKIHAVMYEGRERAALASQPESIAAARRRHGRASSRSTSSSRRRRRPVRAARSGAGRLRGPGRRGRSRPLKMGIVRWRCARRSWRVTAGGRGPRWERRDDGVAT